MTAALTALALLAFAANSLLARAALVDGAMDPALYTGVRLAAGAAVLALLLRGRTEGGRRWGGSWAGAASLLAYALLFSLAYVRLGVAAGALVLFAAVQATMLGWGALRGQAPTPRAWLGLAVAMAGLVTLLAPGLTRPDPGAAALMALSGMAWAAYTLLGRRAGDPTIATAGNFVRTVPAATALIAWPAAQGAVLDSRGLALAVVSGALASGAGYAVWYRAVPRLTVTQAASVQLAVPVVAAAGAALLVGETPTLRLVLAGTAILAGIALAVVRPRP